MKLVPTPLPGAFVIELERHVDERGFFARTFCRRELAQHGLEMEIAQANLSYNRRRATLRGLHFQTAPHEEIKIVSCTAGAIFDVIVDLRKESPAYGRAIAVELDAESRRMLYVPKGFAHGFQTLVDHTVVAYLMSTEYVPEAARGVRWDDPSLGIAWPIDAPILSQRDAAFPSLAELG